jgi:hypothetical protein
MGAFGHLQCTANCGHPMAFLHAGAGIAAVREVKRCTECGQVMDVLAARVEHGKVIDASGRGRCPDCRSQRLRPAPEVEALIDGEPGALARCPRCDATLAWESTGIWD